MSGGKRRMWIAAAMVLTLLVGVVGLVWMPAAPARVAPSVASVGAEPALVTEAQRKVGWFFDEGRAATGSGRGLFETDFFKPPPAPPPKPPPPPPPATRELPVFYRGLASFSDGGRVAYLVLENRTVTLDAGDAVTDGWILAEFDSERAVLAKDDKKVTLPFNRRATLTVPAK